MTIEDLVNIQRNFYYTNKTLSFAFRMNALKKLYNAVIEYEDRFKKALFDDLNKSTGEAYLTEIGVTLKEIKYLQKNLKKLMKVKKRKTEITNFPAKSIISPHPYGVTLIMSPWNYPLYLTLGPLAGAIAAGNTVIIKPSNYSSNTTNVMKELIESIFDESYIALVKGGRKENQDLLEQKFDYIFFTGSTSVGKLVMEKASAHLTPITLELGGKSPTLVTEDAKIDLAAKRIVFGKLINVGQTCVAPDYVLVKNTVKNELIERISYYIKNFYGEKPLENINYGKIINEKHFARLIKLMANQNIVFGGSFDSKTLKIEPTIIDLSDKNSPIMQEEIFGPILPIISYDTIDDAINYIRSKPHPLALYLFTESKIVIDKVLNTCQFGGGCINDTIMQVASQYLPFGGVGQSGMGSYHGEASFATFSHYRSLIKKSTRIDIPLRYLPLSKKTEKLVKRILK